MTIRHTHHPPWRDRPTNLPDRFAQRTDTRATGTGDLDGGDPDGGRATVARSLVGRTMTIGADVPYIWPDAIVDAGPIELRAVTGDWSG
jgi:hypothetical protein